MKNALFDFSTSAYLGEPATDWVVVVPRIQAIARKAETFTQPDGSLEILFSDRTLCFNGKGNDKLFENLRLALVNYHYDNETNEYAEQIRQKALIDNLQNLRIDELDLSVRARNCCKANNLETVNDLVRTSRQDMLKMRNFGKRSLTEIDEIIESMGLTKYREQLCSSK